MRKKTIASGCCSLAASNWLHRRASWAWPHRLSSPVLALLRVLAAGRLGADSSRRTASSAMMSAASSASAMLVWSLNETRMTSRVLSCLREADGREHVVVRLVALAGLLREACSSPSGSSNPGLCSWSGRCRGTPSRPRTRRRACIAARHQRLAGDVGQAHRQDVREAAAVGWPSRTVHRGPLPATMSKTRSHRSRVWALRSRT